MPSSNQVVTGQLATKVCTKCGKTLPLSHYSVHQNGADGLTCQCKSCRNKRSIDNWNSKSDAEYLWKQARARCRRSGREFDITIEDVAAVDSDNCPYLLMPMKRYPMVAGGNKKKMPNQDSKTLDRIDSAKGYVPGNIIVCSWKANRLLSDATLQDMSLLVHNFRRILLSTKPTNQ